MDSNEPKTLKILLIGDSGVGKTAFLTMFCYDTFISEFIQTVGIDFKKKKVRREDQTIVLEIWDAAGQERYRSLTYNYYRGADAFVVMFDLTNVESFCNCKQWLDTIKQHSDNKSTVVVLVGTKIDRIQELNVFDETIEEFTAEQNIVKYFETSARNKKNLEEVFEYIIEASIKEPTPPVSPTSSPPPPVEVVPILSVTNTSPPSLSSSPPADTSLSIPPCVDSLPAKTNTIKLVEEKMQSRNNPGGSCAC